MVVEPFTHPHLFKADAALSIHHAHGIEFCALNQRTCWYPDASLSLGLCAQQVHLGSHPGGQQIQPLGERQAQCQGAGQWIRAGQQLAVAGIQGLRGDALDVILNAACIFRPRHQRLRHRGAQAHLTGGIHHHQRASGHGHIAQHHRHIVDDAVIRRVHHIKPSLHLSGFILGLHGIDLGFGGVVFHL